MATQVLSETVTVTTDGSGDATAYTTQSYMGMVMQVTYTKTDFSDGVDFDLTGKNTGVVVWSEDNVNATATRSPTQQAHLNSDGSVVAGSTRPVFVVGEPIQIVVANGGASKTGRFTVVVVS